MLAYMKSNVIAIKNILLVGKTMHGKVKQLPVSGTRVEPVNGIPLTDDMDA